MNPTTKRKIGIVEPPKITVKVTEMEKQVPTTERERTLEMWDLLRQLEGADLSLLTTWELQTIEELKQGKASTPVRLRDLRGAVRRIHGQKS